MAATVCLVAVSACAPGPHKPRNATDAPGPPPPAVSSIDRTVAVRWSLADTFDVKPDGTCAGRDSFRGMSHGTRVLLRGTSTGWDVETTATAFVVRWPTATYRGRPLLDDDYLYCTVDAVFAPSMPDPEGYSAKFAGAGHWYQLGKPSRTPFGKPERPGYGSYRIVAQSCPTRLAAPDEEC